MGLSLPAIRTGPRRRAWTLAIAVLALATGGCGYVKMAKIPLTPKDVVAPQSPPMTFSGGHFVSAATVDAVTSPSGYRVTSELGVSVGTVVNVTSGSYTVYLSPQAVTYSP